MKRTSQKLKHLFLNYGKSFHFSHKAIYRFCQVVYDFIITQLVMRHQVYQSRITLQIVTQVGIVIYNFIEIVYCGFIITITKVKGSNLILNNRDTVLVNK